LRYIFSCGFQWATALFAAVVGAVRISSAMRHQSVSSFLQQQALAENILLP
jgi:hypothetical protein